MRKNKIIKSVLITFIFLSCLSAVSAQDLSDDLYIQDSSSVDLSNQDLSVSESAVNNDENYQSELVDDIDNNQNYQENLQESDYADEIVKSSESCNSNSILGVSDSGQEVLGDGMDDQNPIIIVDIDPDPTIIQVIVYTGDSYYVEGNTFADIQNTISRAKHGDAIILNPGTTYIGDGSPIQVNKDLTFAVHGTNAVLDAQNLSRIMEVGRDCQVSISNVDFINGNATGDKHSGGAIVWGGPNGILKNCNFYNNHAEFHAGAVLWGQNDATIENCNFINNSAADCGNLVIFGYRDTVKNCNFYNNSCDRGGAIYIFYDGNHIYDCNFEDNSAIYGGAILALGVDNTISNCNFVNNPGSYGGAIYSKCTGLSISSSRFSGNSAIYGGGIFLYEGSANISNCNFANNSATYYYGGAICTLAHDTNIMNSNFTNNYANGVNGYGGAICIYAINDTVSNCSFKNNTAALYGGAIFTAGVETEIDGETVSVSNGLITGSSFVDNFAQVGNAIRLANVDDEYINTVTDCSFKYKVNSTALIGIDDNLCLTFTLESSLDYYGTVYGPSIRTNMHFWNGESFTTASYMPYFSTIKGADQNIILEIYNSTNKLVANISSSTDSSGQINYDYRSLPDGQYTYKVYHPDNDDFSFIQNQGSFERHHIPTSVSISVTDVTYPGTAVATITASSPGTYKLIIAGTSYDDIVFTDSEISNGNGKASKNVNVDLLGANDSYTASVTYERNDNYDSASNQTTFKVLKAGSSIDVSGSTIYYGNDAVLNYQVENGSLNMVGIKKGSNALQDGVDYSFTLNDNAVTISGLAEGVYTVSFTTVVDNNHTASNKEVTVTVNPLVDLSVVAAVNNQTPLYGDTVVYTITVTNNGPSTATDVLVSDTIPEGMNVSSSDADYIGNGVWNISSIGVGSENAVTLTLYATVNTLETLSNEINVSSKEEESNVLDNKATAPLISPLPIVDMAVAMIPSYDVETLRIGDNLVYTINLTNNGPFDATEVIVADEIDTNLLSLVSATLDGETIDFSNNFTIDSIPNGSSRIIVLTFEVINNGTITNIVSVGSSEFEVDESDNIVSDDSVYANPLVDLSISISVDNQVPAIGDTIVYTITVINNGPSTATDVVVSDTIPEGMNVSSSDADYIGNGVWNISSIGVGSENAVTLTLYATLNALETLNNKINVISTEYDSNAENNKADITVNVLPVYNLKISTVATASSVKIGDSFKFTVTVINEGPYDALDVKVTEKLSSLVKLVSAEASVGTYNSSTNVWNIGDLGIDTPVSLVLTVQAISNGTIENSVGVGSSAYDLNDSDNTFIVKNIVSKRIATKIVYKNMTTAAIDTSVDGKKGQYFSITLKDGSNKVLASKTVQITLNKVVYKVKTNSNGVAKLQINLKNAGTYTASIKFAGDSKYLGSSVSAKIKVTKQKPKLSSSKKTFKVKAKTKKLTATLKTSRGKILKGKKIVFTIKGKKYTVKTNKKGIATANIKLTKKGTFTCTIKYAGDKTYSAITKKIKVVLK